MQEAIGEGDTIRTIVKFLSQDDSQERKEAVFLLYELSKAEILSEKIGDVYGAVLKLMGVASSKSENVLVVEKAGETLENLESCEKNVLQMAENGTLQPLLRLLLEGIPSTALDDRVYIRRDLAFRDSTLSIQFYLLNKLEEIILKSF